jgi:hypothetical protein
MTDQHNDDGSPATGGPSSSDPYAPPPPGWQRPAPPAPRAVDLPPPPADAGSPLTPPAQWSAQQPPYAAPPGWAPPPPPYASAPVGQGYPPPAAGGWQPTASPGGWQPGPAYGAPGGWPPAPQQAGQQPYGWPPPPGRTAGTNGYAIAALICGLSPIIGIGLGFGSLLGLIFGIVAVRQIRRDGSGGRGMAITGIVLGALGLVVVALIVVGLTTQHSSNGTSHPGQGSANTISTMARPSPLRPTR